MLTALESMKLRRALQRFSGIQTPKDALDLAVFNEQTCRDLGAFDPSFSHFKAQQLELEQLALLLEKAGPVPQTVSALN